MRSIIRIAGALLLTAASASAALALTMSKQDFTCPIGGEKFTTDVVNSHTQFGIRLDLRPIGAMLSPIPLPVCPGNGFVMFKNEFTPEDIKALEPIVLSDDYRQARKQHVDYYMVAFMRAKLGAEPLELARLYQRASWEAENRYASQNNQPYEKPELVVQYRTLALQNLDAFLEKDQSYSTDWWTASVVAAELERLLGHFDAVQKRLAGLPVDKLAIDSPVRKAIDQIGAQALKRNANPEKFVSR